MTTTAQPTARTVVQREADALGYGTYSQQINEAVRHVESGNFDALQRALVQYGLDERRAADVTDRIEAQVREVPATEDATTDGFDKDAAVHVLRTFLQEGYDHSVNEAEYDEDEVDALLILAGLMDEPEPVVEAASEEQVEAVDPSLFQRLVAFARRNGFTG